MGKDRTDIWRQVTILLVLVLVLIWGPSLAFAQN